MSDQLQFAMCMFITAVFFAFLGYFEGIKVGRAQAKQEQEQGE